MIAQIKGHLIGKNVQKDHARVLVDVNGIGYEILMGLNASGRLPSEGSVTLAVFQVIAPYDGAVSLYGFLSQSEREIFLQLKENVPGVGPKKALESLDRIMKSLPDFKRAILDKDIKLLVGVFGFSRKTAEKLVYSLRDRMESLEVDGREKWGGTAGAQEMDAVSALAVLGYTEHEARNAVSEARGRSEKACTTQELLKSALKHLSAAARTPGS